MKPTFLKRPSTLIPVLLLVLLGIAPWAAEATGQQFWLTLLARIMIYAIAASALNLALGFGGLVSFGHALFLGLGAYAVALPAFMGVGSGWVHLAVCVGVCALVSLITGAISLRTSGIAFIMITLAFAQMGFFLLVSLKTFGGDDGLPISLPSTFGPLSLNTTGSVYWAAFCLLAALTWWMSRLRVTPFGMTLRAARENARRVNAIGLRAPRYQLAAYVISGTICGVAGLLLANLNAFASPGMLSWVISGELIVMVVLGGMGTVFGPLLGAAAFLGVEEILKHLTEHWMAVFGPLIVLMALLGKKGIVGMLQKLDSASTEGASR